MTIDFPLDQLFVETFRGHPLGDMAWLYYVSGGNRDRVNYYLSDSRVGRVLGSQIFETNTYRSIPQLITVWEHIVDTYLFIPPKALHSLITTLFDLCDWMQDMDNGPLSRASAAEIQMFEHFTKPDSQSAGLFVNGLYTEMKRQFRTKFESQAKSTFENFHDAREYFSEQLGAFFINPHYDSSLNGNMLGFDWGKTDASFGYNHKAVVPLMLDKISEVVTHFYKEKQINTLIGSYDKYFNGSDQETVSPRNAAPFDIVFFIAQQSKPNERLNMPQDLLADSSFFMNREYIDTLIKDKEHASAKGALLTLFALAGHDYTRMMGNALTRYQNQLSQGTGPSGYKTTLTPFLAHLEQRVTGPTWTS